MFQRKCDCVPFRGHLRTLTATVGKKEGQDEKLINLYFKGVMDPLNSWHKKKCVGDFSCYNSESVLLLPASWKLVLLFFLPE